MLGKKLESNWICHCDSFNKPQTEIPSPEQPREIILERHENGESNSYFFTWIDRKQVILLKQQ